MKKKEYQIPEMNVVLLNTNVSLLTVSGADDFSTAFPGDPGIGFGGPDTDPLGEFGD